MAKTKRVAAGSGSGSEHFKGYNAHRAQLKHEYMRDKKAGKSAPTVVDTNFDLPF